MLLREPEDVVVGVRDVQVVRGVPCFPGDDGIVPGARSGRPGLRRAGARTSREDLRIVRPGDRQNVGQVQAPGWRLFRRCGPVHQRCGECRGGADTRGGTYVEEHRDRSPCSRGCGRDPRASAGRTSSGGARPNGPGTREGERSEQQVALREERGRPGARELHDVEPGRVRCRSRQARARRQQRDGHGRCRCRGGRAFGGTARRNRQPTTVPGLRQRERAVTVAGAAGHGAQLGGRHTGIHVGRLNPEGEDQGKNRQTCSRARHRFRALPVRSRRRNRARRRAADVPRDAGGTTMDRAPGQSPGRKIRELAFFTTA